MKTFITWAVVAGLCPSLSAARPIDVPQVLTPPGVDIRLTIDGPVFVDADGMTLYKLKDDYGSCDAVRYSSLRDPSYPLEFTVQAPDSDKRRSCLEKRPPLLARADATPFGKWTIVAREHGVRQWAYDGKPLYRSIKDRRPGDVNGSSSGVWTVASASLPNLPPEFMTSETARGVAIATVAGKTLYLRDRDVAADPKRWQPVVAPALVSEHAKPDWSVVVRPDGVKQWAYRDQPVYTYVYDDPDAHELFADSFGGPYGGSINGWHVLLFKEAPRYPAEVTVQTVANTLGQHSSDERLYASAEGKTLYTMHCVEATADRLDCDDLGDTDRYWLSFCGGPARCGQTWHPVLAPEQAKPTDGVWSVVTRDRDDVWREPTDRTHAVTIWAYRGRPVFSYARDVRPGDCNGQNNYHHLAYPIVAYDSVQETR